MTGADPLASGRTVNDQIRGPEIATGFSHAERTRFRNLLELANSSEYAGERENALNAARRIAERHGLSMEEAARWQPDEPPPMPAPRRPQTPAPAAAEMYRETAADLARTLEEKRRRDEAIRLARMRGLDAEERRRASQPPRAKRVNRARRDPWSHAAVLLKETALPFSEIADITGLDIYGVVGLKLKLRKAS